MIARAHAAASDRAPALAPAPAPALAPAWHTAALVALVVCVSASGLVLSSLGRAGAGAMPQLAPELARDAGAWPRWAVADAPIALVQVALAVYVSRVGRPRSALAGLVGRTWRTGREALVELAVAALLACAIEAVEVVCARWSVPSPRACSLAPASMAGRLAWVPLATCIGVSEELVYRGYLRAQLTAFTGRAWMGIVLQAVLFGVAHLDQGFAFAARACVYGVALGVVARARGSLVPGMICHVGVDLVGGLL